MERSRMNAVINSLLEGDVLVQDKHGENISITDDFRINWKEAKEYVHSRDLTRLELEGNFRTMIGDQLWGLPVGRTPSYAALLADVATAEVIPEYLDDWGTVESKERAQLVGTVRALLVKCPICESSLTTTTKVVKWVGTEKKTCVRSCESCMDDIILVPDGGKIHKTTKGK